MNILIHFPELAAMSIQLHLSVVITLNVTLTLTIPLIWLFCQRDAEANVKYEMCEAHEVLDINCILFPK